MQQHVVVAVVVVCVSVFKHVCVFMCSYDGSRIGCSQFVAAVVFFFRYVSSSASFSVYLKMESWSVDQTFPT